MKLTKGLDGKHIFFLKKYLSFNKKKRKLYAHSSAVFKYDTLCVSDFWWQKRQKLLASSDLSVLSWKSLQFIFFPVSKKLSKKYQK